MMKNKSMNDFIRSKAGSQPVASDGQQSALTDQQLERIAYFLEKGVVYADALAAVRGDQAKIEAPKKITMDDFIRRASGH